MILRHHIIFSLIFDSLSLIFNSLLLSMSAMAWGPSVVVRGLISSVAGVATTSGLLMSKQVSLEKHPDQGLVGSNRLPLCLPWSHIAFWECAFQTDVGHGGGLYFLVLTLYVRRGGGLYYLVLAVLNKVCLGFPLQ